MMRLVGAALVAAGTAWLGFRAAAALGCRVRALEDMTQGLVLLEQELELDGPPLPELMERLARSGRDRPGRCSGTAGRRWSGWRRSPFPRRGGGWSGQGMNWARRGRRR